MCQIMHKKCPPQKAGKQVIDIEDIVPTNVQPHTNKSGIVKYDANAISKLMDKKKIAKSQSLFVLDVINV